MSRYSGPYTFRSARGGVKLDWPVDRPPRVMTLPKQKRVNRRKYRNQKRKK